MINFVDNYCEFPTVLRKPMWQIWHNLLIKFDKDRVVDFMNYGYERLNGDAPLILKEEDEINRYCIQLYDHVVEQVDLKNKDVIEVGSGRGGGASYITRYYNPKSYKGIDISKAVIDYCNRHHKVKGLSFIVGQAEKLPIKHEKFDAVINVESARCYEDVELFFNEVYRVLKDDGHFLFTDMIEKDNVATIREKLQRCGFKIENEKVITKNVAKGLQLDSNRREMIIKKRIPSVLKRYFRKFAGTEGTKRYDSFNNGKFEYISYVIRKN